LLFWVNIAIGLVAGVMGTYVVRVMDIGRDKRRAANAAKDEAFKGEVLKDAQDLLDHPDLIPLMIARVGRQRWAIVGNGITLSVAAALLIQTTIRSDIWIAVPLGIMALYAVVSALAHARSVIRGIALLNVVELVIKKREKPSGRGALLPDIEMGKTRITL
jgi:hypothetical protein